MGKISYADSSDLALVIIDMQTGFERSNRVVDAVVEEVNDCIKRNGRIIIVETQTYRLSFGKTYPQIIKACGEYEHQTIIEKAQNGGSCEVFNELNTQSQTLPKVIRIVGGYAEQCLQATVVGMSRHIFREKYDINIIIPTHAVYASYPRVWNWGYLFKGSRLLHNVSLEENGYDDCSIRNISTADWIKMGALGIYVCIPLYTLTYQ